MSSEDPPAGTETKAMEEPPLEEGQLEQASETAAPAEMVEPTSDKDNAAGGANRAESGDKDGTEEEDEELNEGDVVEDSEERENGMEIDEVVVQGAPTKAAVAEAPAPAADAAPTQNEEKNESVAEESSKPVESGSYSTRGRSGESSFLDVLADAGQLREREAEVHLPREKEHGPSVKPSFLSDSLTEEERRTRTRYIPDVDGMSMLRKTEIKSDLLVARGSLVTSASVANTLAKKIRRSREDEMDMDDTISPSDDDKAADILRLGTRTLEVSESLEYDIPSTAFVTPSGSGLNGDGAKGKPNPPTAVEAVTAFNPPRPPESVGPKKKHRMLRWERRPADIEADLTTYRKTVQKTREELMNAQLEKDRIIMLDNHLRRNYLSHLECMDDELAQISDETAKVQQDCVSAADLLTSRTRSRGAGKSSYVMRDVLAVLRARGAELQEKGISMEPEPGSTVEAPSGVGGVGSFSFGIWDNSKKITVQKTCNGWIVPGDKVSCPKGKGVVVKIVPCEQSIEEKDKRKRAEGDKKDKTKVDESSEKEVSDKETKAKTPDSPRNINLGDLAGPRVDVEVDSSVFSFPPEDIKSLENPASFQDSRLALRWRGMMETAPLFGETLDVEALAKHLPERTEDDDIDGDVGAATSVENQASFAEPKSRSLPFGANLIPTSVGRGAFVAQTDIETLDKTLDDSFFRSTFVLGVEDNPGVPHVVHDAEKKEQERIRLKARLRQLRNEVNRQRRIRLLNQRTHAATEERAVRIESLVSEMRTDLKNLKRRLDEEVSSLGIEETEADKIFQAYNSRHQSGEGLESPFKRSRSSAEMDLDTEEEEIFEGQDGSGTEQATAAL